MCLPFAPPVTNSVSRVCPWLWSALGCPCAAVLSASKSYSERLFRYARIDRLDPEAAAQALRTPAQEEGADFTEEALTAMYEVTAGYPYFIQPTARLPGTWRRAAQLPPTTFGWRRRSRSRNSPSASSAPATSALPRPSVSICGRWPRSPRISTWCVDGRCWGRYLRDRRAAGP